MQNPQECPECHEVGQIVEDTREGHSVCTNCGAWGDEMCIVDKDWREFADDDKTSTGVDPNRVGAKQNLLSVNQELDSTMVGDGNSSSVYGRMEMSTAVSSAHKRIAHAREIIHNLANVQNINRTIITRAEEYILMLEQEKVLRGKKIKPYAAVCLYLACRQLNFPVQLKDLAVLSELTRKQLNGAKKKIDKVLKLKKEKKHNGTLITRFCQDLKLGGAPTVQLHAKKIGQEVKKENILEGKQPATIAGAVIYMALQLLPSTSSYKRTIEQVAEKACMASDTILKAYQVLWNHRAKILDQEALGIDTEFINSLPSQ